MADEPAISFESGESLVEITGSQAATLERNSTVVAAALGVATAFDTDPGRLVVQYQGGDSTEREASVVVDPSDAGNHILEFLLRAPNVRDATGAATKGRVQLNAYESEMVRTREVRLRVRMNLADGFAQLRDMAGKFGWLTLSEWWNNAGWTGQAYPFRITVNVAKPLTTAGSQLFFTVGAETLNLTTNQWDTKIWSQMNTAVPVPVGQWVTLEYYFREGDASEGRFYLAMVPDGGSRTVLFDQRGWTHHPDDPAPDGLTHVNPVKLYTSKAVIEQAAATGHPLRVHWDDLGFRLCRQRFEEAASPCAPETFQ